MANTNANPPSFSPRRKWLIGLNVAIAVIALLALIGMVNYLASRYYARLQSSSRGQFSLSPQTLKVLRSVTNEIKITVFFDSRDSKTLRDLVTGLLKDYNQINRNIIFRTVDPSRNPGEAEMVLAAYKVALRDKNFVVVECAGRSKVFYESELADYRLEPVRGGKPNEFDKQMAAFRGEIVFTTAIFNIANPREYKVCFLQDHGEHDPEKTADAFGYSKFAEALKERTNVRWQKISLFNTNDVPADCNLLVIAGPQARFGEEELSKVENYLKQGGRLFVLLNNVVRAPRTGIERVLAQWGVGVADDVILDPENSPRGTDLLAERMDYEHPIMKAFAASAEGLRLRLVLPRSLGRSSVTAAAPSAPEVKAIATTGQNATQITDIRERIPYPHPGQDLRGVFPLVLAVEQGGVEGVSNERGAMRMVVVGDSLCMDNELIDSAGNHHFATMSANWLLDRPQILFEGLVPAPLKEYKLVMTQRQMRAVQWIFLAAMPGCILLFGGLVWLRRRR